MKKIIFYKLFLGLFSISITCQFISAQSPMLNINKIRDLILINPAYIGIMDAAEIGLNYLNQNLSNTDKWHTFSATCNYQFLSTKNSIGLKVLNDKFDGIGNDYLSIGGLYTYSISINRRTKINVGIEAGYIRNILNASYVNTYNYRAYSFNNNFNSIRNELFNMGLGVVIFSPRLYGGFSIDHINKPSEGTYNNSSIQLSPVYSFVLSHKQPIRRNRTRNLEYSTTLSTTIIYQYQDKRYCIDSLGINLLNPYQLSSLTFQYEKHPFLIGISYKYINSETSIFSVQLGFTVYNMDINYNYGFSAYSEKKTNINQISLGYKFHEKKKLLREKRPRGSIVPDF